MRQSLHLSLVFTVNPETGLKAAPMAEWNAYYQNEDEEGEEEEGEHSGRKRKTVTLCLFTSVCKSLEPPLICLYLAS